MPECIICLEDAGPGDLELHSPNRMLRLCMSSCECNGFVHIQCLRDWISRDESTNKTKCPICRTRGENFTLLECDATMPPYQPPVPPPSAPPTSSSRTTIPSQPYQYPGSSQFPGRTLPTIPENPSIIDIHPPNQNGQQSGFNIQEAQEQEHRIDLRRQRLFVILIIILVILVSILTSGMLQ